MNGKTSYGTTRPEHPTLILFHFSTLCAGVVKGSPAAGTSFMFSFLALCSHDRHILWVLINISTPAMEGGSAPAKA